MKNSMSSSDTNSDAVGRLRAAFHCALAARVGRSHVTEAEARELAGTLASDEQLYRAVTGRSATDDPASGTFSSIFQTVREWFNR